MSNISATTNWLDDRMNPIVVKELRQGMQSRSFILIVNLLLAALAAICLLSVMTNPEVAVKATGGRLVYDFLQGALFISCIVFVPMYTLVRLRSERNENEVDLFFSTTLQPKRIARGKFFAGLALVGMLYSVCLPFMLFTYALRGYDIPSMFTSLAFGFLVTALVLAASIVVGCWGAPRALGSLAVLAAAGLLALTAYLIIWVTNEMLESGIGTLWREREFWMGVGIVLPTVFLTLKLLESMAVGLISPPSSDRTMQLRIWASVSIVATYGIYTLATLLIPVTRGPGLFEMAYQMTIFWTHLTLPLVMILLLIAVCEPDGFSKRIMLGRPRGAFASLRLLAFPYTHGASGGILWSVIHAAIIVGIFYVVRETAATTHLGSHPYRNETPWLFLLGIFVLNYCLLGKLVMRAFFIPAAAKHTWVAVLFSLFTVMICTLIITFALDPRHWDRSLLWKLATPFADAGREETTYRLYVGALWAGIVLLLCFPRGWRDFMRYQVGEVKEAGGKPGVLREGTKERRGRDQSDASASGPE